MMERVRIGEPAGRLPTPSGRASAFFVKSVGILLLAVAVLKLVGAPSGYGRGEHFLDPLSGIAFTRLVSFTAAVELGVAVICLFPGRGAFAVALIAWVATNFLLYHMGLWLIGWHAPCACLGYLTVVLRISPKLGNSISLLLAVYMAAGSYLLLARGCRSPPKGDLLPYRNRLSGCGRAGGFTRLELPVVIGVMVALAGLFLPVLPTARGRPHRVACVSNLRRFGAASRLGGACVEGWLGLPGPDCTSTTFLERSLLNRHLSGWRIWRSPAPARPAAVGAATQRRVRTVSLNWFTGWPVKGPAATTRHTLGEIPR